MKWSTLFVYLVIFIILAILQYGEENNLGVVSGFPKSFSSLLVFFFEACEPYSYAGLGYDTTKRNLWIKVGLPTKEGAAFL